ncbi:MAG TPA: EamA family transporter [Vicinamibacteria bacterium]|nr:EamA family transporter [Vicinamibacteria bacterium]
MWVLLALVAGLLQSARNGLARSLAGRISPVLNSWSRFAFNLPFSTALVGILLILLPAPLTSARFYALAFATGVAQLLGSVALIAAFRHASFAQSIVLHKLEVLFMAVLGALFFAETPTRLAWLGILLTVAGVLGMAPGAGRSRFGRGQALAMTAGLLLAIVGFFLKGATEELAGLNPWVGEGRFVVASYTLFHVTWMEVVLLTLWLARPGSSELALVPPNVRRMVLQGMFGFSASLGWFWAYSIAFVAYVKAVGQIESVAAVLYSLLIWKEKEVSRQIPGMALTLAGIALVLLGGSGP